VFLLFSFLCPPPAAACPNCNTSAAAQEPPAAQALNYGIALLAAPPVLILGAIIFFAFRYRNSDEDVSKP
jgi:hypothetical protein